jgi:hypothetical protein
LFKDLNKAKIKHLNGIIISLYFINMKEDLKKDGLMEILLFPFMKEKRFQPFITNKKYKIYIWK